ncbi:dynamin family protein [Rhodoferax sp. 4810]|uniref:Dynamin family protein n=1 Tax=Thiospirillum jenense TaxID=1653858 RepID=A0A839HEI3_9GAMM|nr:dynamin family protein [Thiospirillum jenense]MBB1077304.1 dynamin family protein [Rhodoferax jenense]MBB1127071.1 dynamin family protein [Thiospirillum jenense]
MTSTNEFLSRSLADRQNRIDNARAYLTRTQELFDQFGSAELKTTHRHFGELQQSLASDQVKLVVLGEFSRGKSMLINALLGIDLLPAALETTTATNTFLQKLPAGHTEPFIRVHYQDDRPPQEIAWTDDAALKRWGTELDDSHQAERQQVSHIEVFFDHDLLNKGLVLIDTPGLGTIVKHHEEITHRAIAEAHIALWVQDTGQLGANGSEWEFMRQTLRRNFQKFITVVNKWDRVLEPEDAHDRAMNEEERTAKKLQLVRKNFAEKLGEQAQAEFASLTGATQLFGVSAAWAKDADPERQRRSNMGYLAERIAALLTSGEAQEQILLKPLKQLTDIQRQLAEHIANELVQLNADKSAVQREQELQKLDLDIRELQHDEERETRESRDEHERAAQVMTDKTREELLKPLIKLRDAVDDQVTESYVRRLVNKGERNIGLPPELDQQYKQVAGQLDRLWQQQKTAVQTTLDGLRASYLDAMRRHAREIEGHLTQLNIQLPELSLNLTFDFSVLEEHQQRMAQLNAEKTRLEDEIDTLDGEIARNRIDENKRRHAEANLARVQRQLDGMGSRPEARIYSETYRTSDWGSGFLWCSPSYSTVTRRDDSAGRVYDQERGELREQMADRETALAAIQQEELERTGRRITAETARKKYEKQMAQREKELQKAEQQARQDEEALIHDTLTQLRRNTLHQLEASISGIERYLADSLRDMFQQQAQLLASCVREQMLEPLNAKRTQQQEIQLLLQQSQAQINARRAALLEGERAVADVMAMTSAALTN